MPIGKDDWDNGRTPEMLESQILTFLEKNRPNAYKLSEIMSELGYRIQLDSLGNILLGIGAGWLVQEALKTLLNENRIEVKIIKANGQDTYYRAMDF
ncbi:hypothetical protein MUP77_14185 [Candidatus Bathyarchaeota archaeon]|nr:hypothetical protein [Candidatus Bathyarchaeota archaeon]